ncbi:hypothetical protein BGZ76_003516 [Entomortierella beljakovae]|nr:hypothetical protein BGZ76_003516 [Entomortierella beljakovae]
MPEKPTNPPVTSSMNNKPKPKSTKKPMPIDEMTRKNLVYAMLSFYHLKWTNTSEELFILQQKSNDLARSFLDAISKRFLFSRNLPKSDRTKSGKMATKFITRLQELELLDTLDKGMINRQVEYTPGSLLRLESTLYRIEKDV